MHRLLSFFLTLILTLALFGHALAIPAEPGLKTVKMPDGKKIKVRLFGDERINWFESEDGYTLIKNRNKSFEYAVRDKSGRLIPSGIRPGEAAPPAKKHLTPSREVIEDINRMKARDMKRTASRAAPITGTGKALVLLIEFPDMAHDEGRDTAYFDSLLFGNNVGDMNHYFKEVSYNQFELTGKSYGWYTASENMAYYSYDSDPRMSVVRNLVKDAIDQAVAAGVNFADYDYDNDNIVDHLMIVHAGGDAARSVPDAIWSHWFFFFSAYLANNDTYVRYYTVNSEENYLGIYAHEFMHDMGAPDLYDVNTVSFPNKTYPVGEWCLMAYGSHGGTPLGSAPSHLSGYIKSDIDANPTNGLNGWLDITNISQNGTYTVSQLYNSTGDRLFRVDIPSDNEYFLIENRQQVGCDESLPDAGIVIYHVDEDMPDTSLYINDRANSFFRIAVEDPGGTSRHNGAAYSLDDDQVNFNIFTTPSSNSNDGAASDISIGNISASQEDMTFTLNIFDGSTNNTGDDGGGGGGGGCGTVTDINMKPPSSGQIILDMLLLMIPMLVILSRRAYKLVRY